MKKILLSMIAFYQRWIRLYLPPSCRYTPSCSDYTFEAVQRFGPFHGTLIGVKRLCRCHPFCEGGCDPVPEK